MDSIDFERIKGDVHRTVISRMDLGKLSSVPKGKARAAVSQLIQETVALEKVPLNLAEKEKIHSDLLDEIFGLGPLEQLLNDTTISDILVNAKDKIYVERRGVLQRVDVRFRDDAHLMQVIDRIVSRVGRRVDESSPMVDARLPDGSRVNAIIPPLALDGPSVSIRRFGSSPLTAARLLEYKAISQEMLDVLTAAVKARLSILISGGTGAGKTTFLNMLSGYIPRTERQLLINSLRMRPDRIIVGEVRGEEAFDMLQAMNTGHEGSMATIHANTCRDALTRLESMVAMANFNLQEKAVR